MGFIEEMVSDTLGLDDDEEDEAQEEIDMVCLIPLLSRAAEFVYAILSNAVDHRSWTKS